MLLSLLAWLLLAVAPGGDAAKRAACTKAVGNSLNIVGALSAEIAQQFAQGGGGETELTRCLRERGGDLKKCLKLDDPAARQRIAVAVDKCMTWPDAVVACISDFERMKTPACMREWEAFQGLVSSEPLAEGPPPMWQVALPARAYHVVDAGGGSIVGVGEKELFAVRGKKVAWRKPLAAREVIPLPRRGCVLALAGARAVCLDPASGREMWSAAHPDSGAGHEDEVAFMAGDSAGGQTVIADGLGRMFVVAESACAARAPKCLVPSGKLSEGLTFPTLRILPSGDRAVLDVTRLFLTDTAGKQYAWMAFSTGGPLSVAADGSLLLAYETGRSDKVENVLVRLDPRRCRTQQSQDPLQRCGVVVGERLPSEAGFDAAPIALPGGDMVVEADALRRWGKTRWKTDVGGAGAPLLVGDRIYVPARGAGKAGAARDRRGDGTDARTKPGARRRPPRRHPHARRRHALPVRGRPSLRVFDERGAPLTDGPSP